MKEYFSHDYATRNDEKVKKIIRKHGMLGYGVFWSIIEDLYNNANALQMDCEGIAYDLRVDELIVKDIITNYDLFIIKETGVFSSESIQKRLDHREEKSLKAKKAAEKRWSKDADAMQTHSDSNAIKEKESKEKEIKVKDIKEREIDFRNEVSLFSNLYTNDMLDSFSDYWTESKPKGKKLKYEMQQTFSIERRLKTWFKKSQEYERNNKKENDSTSRIEQLKKW